jgi:simple sugar transport system ATP-binding protein
MRGITKRFGAVIANDGIDFDLEAGEIHALLGENGSGKTTLMSILYGLLQPDEGSITLDGEPFRPVGPLTSRNAGIAMIPQRFRLVPTLTVGENVALGLEPRGRWHGALLTEVQRRLADLGARYGLAIDPQARVETLSMGQRQRVEILRALYNEADILLMDEPTSVLTPREVDGLFVMLATMVREENRTVVLVTHKLREVLGYADRMTILRQGRKVATFTGGEATRERLVEAMMGRRADPAADSMMRRPDARAATGRRAALEVQGVDLVPEPGDDLASHALRRVGFSVHAGEIYGIAGVEGNGQQELELVLAGLVQPTVGEVRLAGGGAPPRNRIAYIPSDGLRLGLIREFTIAENLLLPEIAAGSAIRIATIGTAETLGHVQEVIARYAVYPPDPALLVRQLSGGNARKVLLARELERRPLLIVAAQPTMGLDVASAAFVREQIRRAAEDGAAVVFISSDLDELLECCDRIAVLYDGQIQGEWWRREAKVAELGAAMAGLASDRPHAVP